MAWDVAEVESAEIAAELVQRACLKERYCRPRGFGSHQSHQQPLILHADNGNAVAVGFREAIARRHARIKARRAGCAALVLQAEGQQRQPLLGITVPHSQVPARLPQPAVCQQGGGMRVGSGFCGLVQPPPPPQRHQIRHASPTSQRCRHRNLPGAHPGLRKGSPGPPKPLEPIHSLLAPASSGVDQ